MERFPSTAPALPPPGRGGHAWRAALGRGVEWGREMLTRADPDFSVVFVPALVLTAMLFARSPFTNCIFDEQEALLANPYVQGHNLGWIEAFRRDFWGLPPTRSIGSYRPLPNLVWRALWPIGQSPWLLHWVNLVVHAACVALLSGFVWAVTRRRGHAFGAAACYLCMAILTEAVSGIVGLADVLAALFALLSLNAQRLNLGLMSLCTFVCVLLGLLSKESMMVLVPLVPLGAGLLAPCLHRERPRSLLRILGAGLAATLAFVVYTEMRRRLFPVADATIPATGLGGTHAPWLGRGLSAFLGWFQQPRLPVDPMNNPLVNADAPHRIAGAFRVYARGLGQTLFPWTLSGDYSFPAEPIPPRLISVETVLGLLGMVVPPLLALGLILGRMVRRFSRRTVEPANGSVRLLVLAMLWFPIAYLPHSNIFVLLPTVRAERFWVLPAIGLAWVYGWLGHFLMARPSEVWRRRGQVVVAAFLVFQATRARCHALDYADDLAFWAATARAVPNSAKAHLNHAVMLGARARNEERLVQGNRALELAPRWPMAHVYQGDALCRMGRASEAWPHYRRGFVLGPNEPNLIALGLQCLWDKEQIPIHRDELLTLADQHPGSWLAFLATDIVEHGQTYGGVQPKYRPRGYNEGPKKN